MKAHPKYSRQTRESAEYGLALAALLWRKALAQASPEVRGLLLAHAELRILHQHIVPFQSNYPVKPDILVEAICKGEALLTGFSPTFGVQPSRQATWPEDPLPEPTAPATSDEEQR